LNHYIKNYKNTIQFFNILNHYYIILYYIINHISKHTEKLKNTEFYFIFSNIKIQLILIHIYYSLLYYNAIKDVTCNNFEYIKNNNYIKYIKKIIIINILKYNHNKYNNIILINLNIK